MPSFNEKLIFEIYLLNFTTISIKIPYTFASIIEIGSAPESKTPINNKMNANETIGIKIRFAKIPRQENFPKYNIFIAKSPIWTEQLIASAEENLFLKTFENNFSNGDVKSAIDKTAEKLNINDKLNKVSGFASKNIIATIAKHDILS